MNKAETVTGDIASTLPDLQPGTDSAEVIALLRSSIDASRDWLRHEFEQQTDVEFLVHQRSHFIDEILRRIWNWLELGQVRDIALVAVGGYGRGELHPASDIDIMVLLGKAASKTTRQRIQGLVTTMWDIGLEVGQAVRTVRECQQNAREDITVVTNLTETRLLAGSGKVYEKMLAAVAPDKIWNSKKFFRAKFAEQEARHQKYHDTAYNLEPNIKEGPGGLRDIQMIGWVVKRHLRAHRLSQLVSHHFLQQEEYEQLKSGQKFLWKVRFALHLITGRHDDRLLFEYQRLIAAQLGYGTSEDNSSVEHFMRDYFREIMELRRLNEMLLQLFEEAFLPAGLLKRNRIVKLNERFQSRNDYLEAIDDDVFEHYPLALLEVFLLLQQNPSLKGVRASTIRLIRNNSFRIDDDFRASPESRRMFMDIIRQPHGITHELRRMNRYGILSAYLPQFGAIVGLMQFDMFHAYTVDEHILSVVRNLRRFTVPEYADEFPLCSELIRKLEKPELLYLAGLFHDIAKGRGGDHAELGTQDALDFCRQHDLGEYDSRLVAWLVRNHLVMSSTAQRKDISDPDVVNEFAALVGDQLHLDCLYLLTVGDIRGTNPNLWNGWKDSLFNELHAVTSAAIRRGQANPIDKSEKIDGTQIDALKLLSDFDGTAIAPLWLSLGDDYFLRYSADEIAWHTAAILSRQSQAGSTEEPLILLRQKTHRGGTEIFIYMKDQRYLFASITACLDQMDLTIQDARIICSENDYSLDTFIVLERNGETINDEHRTHEILESLKQKLSGPDDFSMTVSREPSRQHRNFSVPTRIHFNSDTDKKRTYMEVKTTDRPGLLSRVGSELARHNLRLHNAMITTMGESVIDVFIISDENYQALEDETLLNTLRDNLVNELNG